MENLRKKVAVLRFAREERRKFDLYSANTQRPTSPGFYQLDTSSEFVFLSPSLCPEPLKMDTVWFERKLSFRKETGMRQFHFCRVSQSLTFVDPCARAQTLPPHRRVPQPLSFPLPLPRLTPASLFLAHPSAPHTRLSRPQAAEYTLRSSQGGVHNFVPIHPTRIVGSPVRQRE